MKQLKNERGLTLVELLAVIVILAIIAAIAAVAIGNVIQNSKDKAILSDAVAAVEGAKIAEMDNACTEDDTKVKVTCSAEQLKPFVEGVAFDNDDKVEITDDSGHKTYKIMYKKFGEIKNQDKYGVGKSTDLVEYSYLLKVLNGGKSIKKTEEN